MIAAREEPRRLEKYWRVRNRKNLQYLGGLNQREGKRKEERPWQDSKAE
jgi:hypothetical protein